MAIEGHPSVFMQILHHFIFKASTAVKNYLQEKEILLSVTKESDHKFMQKVFFILTNTFELKPRLYLHQFLKYGYAEQKMLMCVDAVNKVTEIEAKIKLKKSLTPKRKSRKDSKTPSRRSRRLVSTYGYRSVGRSQNMQSTFSQRMNQSVVTEVKNVFSPERSESKSPPKPMQVKAVV